MKQKFKKILSKTLITFGLVAPIGAMSIAVATSCSSNSGGQTGSFNPNQYPSYPGTIPSWPNGSGGSTSPDYGQKKYLNVNDGDCTLRVIYGTCVPFVDDSNFYHKVIGPIKENKVKWFEDDKTKTNPIKYTFTYNVKSMVVANPSLHVDLSKKYEYLKGGSTHPNVWKNINTPFSLSYDFWMNQDGTFQYASNGNDITGAFAIADEKSARLIGLSRKHLLEKPYQCFVPISTNAYYYTSSSLPSDLKKQMTKLLSNESFTTFSRIESVYNDDNQNITHMFYSPIDYWTTNEDVFYEKQPNEKLKQLAASISNSLFCPPSWWSPLAPDMEMLIQSCNDATFSIHPKI